MGRTAFQTCFIGVYWAASIVVEIAITFCQQWLNHHQYHYCVRVVFNEYMRVIIINRIIVWGLSSIHQYNWSLSRYCVIDSFNLIWSPFVTSLSQVCLVINTNIAIYTIYMLWYLMVIINRLYNHLLWRAWARFAFRTQRRLGSSLRCSFPWTDQDYADGDHFFFRWFSVIVSHEIYMICRYILFSVIVIIYEIWRGHSLLRPSMSDWSPCSPGIHRCFWKLFTRYYWIIKLFTRYS